MNGRRGVFLVLLLLSAFGLRLCRIADLGTQADEGVHVAVAERLAAGDALYRDLMENRTPGVEWLLGIAFWLGGGSIILGRLLSVGAAVLTVAALVSAGQQAGSRVGGVVAAILFALAPLPIFWSRFTMLEHFQAAAAVLSVTCALRGLNQRKRRWWLVAGLMAGLSILSKQSGVVLLGSLLLFLFLRWLGGDRTLALGATLSMGTGLGLALFPLGLVLVAQGTLDEFAYLVSGVERLTLWADWPEKIPVLYEFALRRPVIPLAATGLVILPRRGKPALWLLSIWATVEWIALLLPARLEFGWSGFSHYAVPAIAATCLLAGCATELAWRVVRTAPGLWRRVLIGSLAVCAAGAIGGFAADLDHAVGNSDYPMAGFEAEAAIGRGAALVTPDGEAILTLANSVFYHWADRRPASRFFHYPSFLPTSSLAAESEAALLDALNSPMTGAVLVSRLYLEDRIPAAVVGALWNLWTPVAIFPYAYQRDVVLLLPGHESPTEPEAVEFEGGIQLTAFGIELLSPTTLLVRLDWRAETRPQDDYIVFTHVLDPQGSLTAQNDGFPVVGFRPMTSWAEGESIADYHWLELPADRPAGEYQVRVGLYRADTGERLLAQGKGAETDHVARQVRFDP